MREFEVVFITMCLLVLIIRVISNTYFRTKSIMLTLISYVFWVVILIAFVASMFPLGDLPRFSNKYSYAEYKKKIIIDDRDYNDVEEELHCNKYGYCD